MPPKTTESPDPSLQSAAVAIEGLLSPKGKDKPAHEPQTVVAPKKTEQVVPAEAEPIEGETETAEEQAAREAAEAAAATPDPDAVVDEGEEDPDAAQTEPLRKYKVKVDGQDEEVTEDELLKGYSRTAAYTRRMQQLADERRVWERTEKTQLAAKQDAYVQALDTIKTHLEQITPKEPDWENLRAQVAPEVFAAEVLAWQTRTKNIETVNAEKTKVEKEKGELALAGFKTYLSDQEAKLQAALPDFKDPVKATKLQEDLQEFAMGIGFTPEDLRTVTDHRLVLVLHKAMQFDQLQARRPKAVTKVERVIAASAPGSRPATTPNKKQAQKAAANKRLAETGSVADGAAAIALLLGDLP
jgi:hypothetical protein